MCSKTLNTYPLLPETGGKKRNQGLPVECGLSKGKQLVL